MTKFINAIEIKELYGYYNYKVNKNEVDNPLIIIYGDNGCGKTTLLELVFNLLSVKNGKGQKSKIAKIKFKEFIVSFDGNIQIIAKRDKSDIGSFSFQIKEENKIKYTLFMESNSECNIDFSNSDKIAKYYLLMLEYIEKLNVSIHYLTDKRKLYSDTSTQSTYNKENRYLSRRESLYFDNEEKEDELVESIKILESWIKKNVLVSSRVGEKNMNSIYKDLIKRVITNNTTKKITNDDLENLKSKLINIRESNKEYSKYGLSSRIETKDIEIALSNFDETNNILVYNILEPYVESLESRLNSLENIQNLLEFLISSTNKYFLNKTLKYDISKGFSIFSNDTDERLEFTMLSSGEKQLLLLFSNIITSSDNASIFIIDEPEISLNIKWQRKLINTLIKLSNNNKIQFIFATHSIELLTSYKSSVNKLVHLEK